MIIMSEQSLQEEPKELEIDILDIIRKIIAIRKKLYKAAIIGLVIGIIVGLSIPKEYTVRVTLSPEMGGEKGNSGIAGVAASFLGGGTGIKSGTDALNASLSSDIVSSTPFLLELLNMEVVDNEGEPKMLSAYLMTESSPWWNYVIGLPGIINSLVKSWFIQEEISSKEKFQGRLIILTKDENAQIGALKKKITATVDKKTAITSVNVTLQDPKVAAIVADSVVHRLQEYIISYRTSKAKEDCVYLEKLFEERKQEYYVAQKKYADYVDAHDNLILQSVRAEQERLQNDMNLFYQVYSQVANQLQVARAKVQEGKPVFAIVEPAVVPIESSSMRRSIYIFLFVFLSIFGTIGWFLLGKAFMSTFKNEVKM